MADSTTTTAAAYTARVLPLDEWQARQAELPYPPGALDPSEFKWLVVVEDREGRIVASWCAMNMVMLEGLSVTPAHPMAAKHLLFGMLKTLLEMNTPGALTRIEDQAVRDLAAHAGFVQLPGTLHQIDLRPQEST
jgi:hypothetical protein